jgi:LacI family transcriptional regulator
VQIAPRGRRTYNLVAMKDAHVTLRDVARRARVSVSTASRVLCGMKVRDGNQERVVKAAKDLGYVHNEAARALRNVRTMTVGMVFNELTSAIGIELLSTISAKLDAHGYSVFVSTAQGDGERYDRLVRRYLERRVDALFCVHAAGEGAALERFLAANIPVIALLSRRAGYERLPLIAPSIRKAGDECLARLNALGHRNLVVLSAQRVTPTLDLMIRLATTAGMNVRSIAIDSQSFDPDAALKQALDGTPRATAVITNHTEAAQLLTAADRLSLHVPDALSLVAIRDRAVVLPVTRVPLSMINIEPSRVGVVAAERMLEQLSGGASPDNELRIETGVWLERSTTATAP